MIFEKINKTTIKIGDKTVSIENALSILDCIEHMGFLYVLIDFKIGDKEENNNIWKFDSQAQIVWKSSKVDIGDDNRAAPFTSIRIQEETLIGYNWIGSDYTVKLETGEPEIVKDGSRPW